MFFVGFALQSLHYGNFATDEKPWYDETKRKLVSNKPRSSFYFDETKCNLENYYAMGVVCFVISGTVKISVALVLYRLDTRPLIRSIIIFDIATCCVWTIASTLLGSLFCSNMGLYWGVLDTTTCINTMYARESLYIIYDVFHIILPVFILWKVQIGRMMKLSVIGLFSIGLL